MGKTLRSVKVYFSEGDLCEARDVVEFGGQVNFVGECSSLARGSHLIYLGCGSSLVLVLASTYPVEKAFLKLKTLCERSYFVYNAQTIGIGIRKKIWGQRHELCRSSFVVEYPRSFAKRRNSRINSCR
jgi:hypothetical protein